MQPVLSKWQCLCVSEQEQLAGILVAYLCAGFGHAGLGQVVLSGMAGRGSGPDFQARQMVFDKSVKGCQRAVCPELWHTNAVISQKYNDGGLAHIWACPELTSLKLLHNRPESTLIEITFGAG